ncbi:MAG: putative toxin-antitoxin system toxin component, PIN family [Chloroflexota bacterium]
MRIVLDTNTVVSGLLWHGAPRSILDLAREGRATLFTSPTLLVELEDVLGRPKFAKRLRLADVTVSDLVRGYAALAQPTRVESVPPVIKEDPDDDHVLACAVQSRADYIVSGDGHLKALGKYKGIAILQAHELLEKIQE